MTLKCSCSHQLSERNDLNQNICTSPNKNLSSRNRTDPRGRADVNRPRGCNVAFPSSSFYLCLVHLLWRQHRLTMTASTAIYPSLFDKTVLVTGGAEGIGAATVELFALQGCQVIFLDVAKSSAENTIEHVISLSKKPENQGRPPVKAPIFYECDVTDLPKLQATANKILQGHGAIHVLVNNAAVVGKQSRLPTEKVTLQAWDYNINANLRHIFFLTQAVLPAMKASGGGSIINLGSITWRISDGSVPVYASCKAAIMGLTRAQSKEVGAANVRINSVMPGAIATKRQREEVLTDEYRAEVMRSQSLQRDLEPVEVAKVIVFLGSDEASAITGSSYVVDGGWCSDP